MERGDLVFWRGRPAIVDNPCVATVPAHRVRLLNGEVVARADLGFVLQPSFWGDVLVETGQLSPVRRRVTP